MFPALLLFFASSLVNDVRTLIAANQLPAAEAAARSYKARSGETAEYAAALSWAARGNLAAKRYDDANRLAGEAKTVGEKLLGMRKLDSDAWLPTAIGAAIEVHAQALAARGERSEAVGYLTGELAKYASTSIGERIKKNINLLSLEGRRAPAISVQDHLGPAPKTLAALRGRPVLLFFWAHWCPDCKAMAATIASVMARFAPRGLSVIGPTRLYGYVAGGEPAPEGAERQYIGKVREQFYGALREMPMPLNSANFLAYGASTTPTLVLVDSAGIVRWYHPGAATEAELTGRIEKLLAN